MLSAIKRTFRELGWLDARSTIFPKSCFGRVGVVPASSVTAWSLNRYQIAPWFRGPIPIQSFAASLPGTP